MHFFISQFREEIAKFPIEFQPETTNHFLIRWLRGNLISKFVIQLWLTY